MARRLLLLPILLLSLAAAAKRTPDPDGPTIRQSMLLRHIEVLASDQYGGRAPGTDGGRKTESYIVGQFQGIGLTPAAPAGDWFQQVKTGGPGVVGKLVAAAEGDVSVDHADNIIGKVAGSDPVQGAVFLLAHWDHLGRCRTVAKDSICNGAVDNASGVATLIEVARAVAAGPQPVRDIYFVATTGEERGKLGAERLVAQPPVPLGSIAAVFNLDTVAVAPAGARVGIVGRGKTRLDDLIFDVAREQKRRIDKDSEANKYLNRQDGWPFLQKGVPAVMVGGAFGDLGPIESFLGSRYHGPLDDTAHGLELGGATEDANLDVALVHAFADPSRYPFKPRKRG